MPKTNEKALRMQAAALLRAMNKVTGTSAAEVARKVGLHKGNISAFINQSRVELLGLATISALLRMYGFEMREDRIHVRKSESCPTISYPVTDDVISGIHELATLMQLLGMPCSYRPFLLGSDSQGLNAFHTGGLFFAKDADEIWAAISLDRGSDLADCVKSDDAVTVRAELLLHEDQFEEWRDSTPHRSEVVQFCNFDSEAT